MGIADMRSRDKCRKTSRSKRITAADLRARSFAFRFAAQAAVGVTGAIGKSDEVEVQSSN